MRNVLAGHRPDQLDGCFLPNQVGRLVDQGIPVLAAGNLSSLLASRTDPPVSRYGATYRKDFLNNRMPRFSIFFKQSTMPYSRTDQPYDCSWRRRRYRRPPTFRQERLKSHRDALFRQSGSRSKYFKKGGVDRRAAMRRNLCMSTSGPGRLPPSAGPPPTGLLNAAAPCVSLTAEQANYHAPGVPPLSDSFAFRNSACSKPNCEPRMG